MIRIDEILLNDGKVSMSNVYLFHQSLVHAKQSFLLKEVSRENQERTFYG